MKQEIQQRMREHLSIAYPPQKVTWLMQQVEQLCERYAPLLPARQQGWTQADAMLFAYGDSVREDGQVPLSALHRFLKSEVGDAISFLHLLPFYPYTSDDGFAVTDFRKVRDDLGSWQEICGLSDDYRLVFDGVINHVSASSIYMKRYQSGDPGYQDYFISLDPTTDTSSVLRTRNLPLLHEYQTALGPRWLWTTFSQDQIDLNVANPHVWLEILDVLLFYAQQGASMIRLDAIPYLWKELGTSCAHLPQTHALIKMIRDVYDAVAPHVLLLTETNVPHKENVAYFGDGGDEAQMIYNFSLAPLVLWSLHRGDTQVLTEWAKGLEWVSPHATYLNITATHDGIGMRPTEGILSEEERAELVELSYRHGGDMTGKRNSDGSVSPYELNCSYFDAVNDPNSEEPLSLQVDRFLCSQAIPMALIGMPGIYIHSLLGSRNDTEGVARTGRARSINRAQLDSTALTQELSDPTSLRAQVFSRMLTLLRCRAKQNAFHPDSAQTILCLHPAVFAVERVAQTGETILALHNCSSSALECPVPFASWSDHLSDQVGQGETICLQPYQISWLTPQS